MPVTFTIFLVIFIDLVGFGIVIPIMPYYAKEFGASVTALGFLMASFSAMQFFFAPVWGKISDRVGRRPVILFSLLGTVVAMCVMGLAQSLFWLFVARIFAGVCSANISTAAAYIADITPPNERAKGMGIIGAGFGLGFIFGPAIGGILSKYGYAVPMYAAAVLALVDFIFAYFWLPEPEKHTPKESSGAMALFNMSRISDQRTDQRTKIAILLFFLMTFAFTQIEVSFALFMLEKYGYGATQSGYLLALMGILGATIQGGLIGKLSKKYGEVKLIIFGSALTALGLFGVSTVFHMNFMIAMIGLVAIGNGLNNPSLLSLASLGAPSDKKGATLGIYHSVGSLARVFGPLTGGFIFDRLGAAAPFFLSACIYSATFLIISGFNKKEAVI